MLGEGAVSLIMPIVVGIHKSLQDLAPKLTTKMAINLNTKLLESVFKRLYPYEERTGPKVATLLDPRFKKHAFRKSENPNQARLFIQRALGDLLVKTGKQFDTDQLSSLSLCSDEPSTSTDTTVCDFPSLFKFLKMKEYPW